MSGRKRHVLVDTLGLLLVLVVHTADVQDRDGLALVCRRLRRRFPWLRLIFADGAYRGEVAARAAAREGLRLEIVTRDPGTRGFAVLPRRWVVERTFAWLGRNRRLAKDFETTIASAVTMVYLASLKLLVRRVSGAKPGARGCGTVGPAGRTRAILRAAKAINWCAARLCPRFCPGYCGASQELEIKCFIPGQALSSTAPNLQTSGCVILRPHREIT